MPYRPRFVGLAARPRAATPPAQLTSKLCVNGGAGGAPAWLLRASSEHDASPSHPLGSARSRSRKATALSTGGTGSAGGAGRSRVPQQAGYPRRSVEHRHPPRRDDLRQSGGGRALPLIRRHHRVPDQGAATAAPKENSPRGRRKDCAPRARRKRHSAGHGTPKAWAPS
jgi:hypothetical protein